MTSTLTQNANAGFADLHPAPVGLRATLQAHGEVLIHDLGVARDQLYQRWMINASSAAGGGVTIAGGIDGQGEGVWQARLDTDSQTVSVTADGVSLAADLSAAITWHCIEVVADASAGQLTLYINGIERASEPVVLQAIRYAWLGSAFQDASVVGDLDMDQWVIADTPIGVPMVEPMLDHAGDPRRWLVVYNRGDDDSAAWADAYRARRGVPYANLCGLDLQAAELITDAQYHTMRQQIADYLSDNNLDIQVVGVLLGFGAPGYADLTAQGPTPIASYLHTDAADGFAAVNPVFHATIGDRLAASDYTGVRLTGRIDAPDLATAISLIDCADDLIQMPLQYDGGADLVVDVQSDNPGAGPVLSALVSDWTESQAFDRLRLPSTIYDAAAPTSASGEAVVWGWRDAAPPPGYFADPPGRRALCLQFGPEPQPATTLRDPSAADWLNTALQAGYGAVAAASRNYSLSTMPRPEPVFEALRRGWTLAEAWLIGQPFIRGGLQIVGDPLLTIGFPNAGFDVFGPVDRVDQVDPDQPLAILHAGERALQLSAADAPPAGSAARYVVRRIDEHGRAGQATASTYRAINQDQPVRPALPAWPGFDNWRIRMTDGRLQPTAVWPAALIGLGIDRVELQSQAGTDPLVLVDQVVPVVGQRRAIFTTDRPVVSTRYRFRVVQGVSQFHSPWSDWVDPEAAPDRLLTLLETQL